MRPPYPHPPKVSDIWNLALNEFRQYWAVEFFSRSIQGKNVTETFRSLQKQTEIPIAIEYKS